MYRVIDSDDYGASGVETMFFPGGEPHVKIHKESDKDSLLFLKLRTWNDIGIGSLVIDSLPEATPFIPYFPGARQDRGIPRTLEMMEALLNAPSLGHLAVFDPHSQHTVDLLWEPKIFMPSDLDVPIKDDVVGIIAPDEGAVDRARNFKERFYPNAEFVQCTKERDPSTGKLSNYQMPQLGPKGRYIVVDDICDGGGTFNLLAEAFKGQNTNNRLELFVSHGIFSHKRGLSNIDPVYEHITTTDSWCQADKVKGYWNVEDGRLTTVPRLTVLPLAQLFDRIMED